jgi:hypothetical protein
LKVRASPLAWLALLFFGPFVLAVVLYLARDSVGGFARLPNPDREFVEGTPLVPALDLAQAPAGNSDGATLRSRWSLIYARMRACDDSCRLAFRRLNQVFLALGSDRVQLVYLAAAGDPPSFEDTSILFGVLDGPMGATMTGLLGAERLEGGRYFVVDPLGNLILSYPPDADQSRLLEDLERLLDVSRIG